MLLTDRDHTVVFQHVRHIKTSSDQCAEEILESGERSSLNARGLDFAQSPDDDVMLAITVQSISLLPHDLLSPAGVDNEVNDPGDDSQHIGQNLKYQESQLNMISWHTQ